MGTLGIFIGILLLIYLSYKGFSVLYFAPVCALLIAAMNKQPLLDSITNGYMNGCVDFILLMFPITIMGTMLGEIYGQSGATVSIARGIKSYLLEKNQNEKMALYVSVTIIVIVPALLTIGGIDLFAVVFTAFPLVVAIMAENNIPRRFLPGVLLGGVATGAVAAPGSPQATNIVVSQILGSDPRGALIPGLIAWMVALIGSVIYLNFAISRAKAKGETFDYGNSPYMLSVKGGVVRTDSPNFWTSIIPLSSVFVIFNIFKLNILIALSTGIILCLVLFWRYLIKDGNVSSIIKILNDGASNAPGAIFTVGSIAGFGAVVASTPGFQVVLDAIAGFHGPALWLEALSVTIITGITGSSPGGVAVAAPILGPIFIQELGIDENTFHRVATFASTTLDTLPINGVVVTLLSLSGLSHREGYRPIAVLTIVLTSLATIVLVLLLSLFPELA
jgi:H+/gluconate symporter-like permease